MRAVDVPWILGTRMFAVNTAVKEITDCACHHCWVLGSSDFLTRILYVYLNLYTVWKKTIEERNFHKINIDAGHSLAKFLTQNWRMTYSPIV